MTPLLPLGGTFAGLHVESLIGRGGMGVVYRARQDAPARTVALKVLAPEMAADDEARRRFLAEIELLATVEHPHIVPIHVAGEAEDRLYLTMRLLEGPSLRALVERVGQLSIERAIELLAPIAGALDAIHAAGLVHGDVTAANVLLDVHGEPYLTDFGIARRLGATAERRGTLAYLAPERIVEPAAHAGRIRRSGARARPEPSGPAADRYAFACLLVYLLTGRPAFGGSTSEDLLRAHLELPPPALSERRPDLPAALDRVVARGLAKDPEARHPSAGAFLEAVRDAAGPAGFGHRADPVATTMPVAAPRRAARRLPGLGTRGALIALAIVALLLLTGGTVGVGLVPIARGPGQPAVARSATPTPSRRPTPTPRPTPSPRVGAAADVARLRALLPDAIRSSCRSVALEGGALTAAGDDESQAGVAALSCPLSGDGAGSVRYVLYRDEAAVGREWDATVGAAAIPADGSCESGRPYTGVWEERGFLGLGRLRSGRIACWLGAGGRARVDWTVDGLAVRATVRRTDEDIATAYATWRNTDLSPRVPGG